MKFLKILYKIWLKIGEVLGLIWTRILLTIIFFVVIGPISLLMKLFCKDPLKFKFDKNSYWLPHFQKEMKEEDYYHQF
jgi:hypothetical protein